MVKKAKSSFFERVEKAHLEHKDDETRVGSGGDLPHGIEHGVAKLADAKIGIYAKGDYEGEPFFMAAGIVLEPDSVTTVDPKTKKSRVIHIQGLRTQIGPEPLCDTTNQNGEVTELADHWSRVLNHLRLLGIDTKEIDPSSIVAESQEGKYESGPILEALVEAAPTFRFRTWQGKPTAQFPNPRVNHEWRGVCEHDSEPTKAVEEQVEEQPQWESDAAKEEAPTKEPAEKPGKIESPIEVDFLALGKVADSGKSKEAQKAQQTLTGHAQVLGIDGYEEMETWTAVAEAIAAHEEAEPEAETEEEYVEEPEEWAPTEKEVCYMSNGPKKKPTECEIVKVYAKAEKADVKRLDTKKVVKGVPFAKLSATDEPF